MVCRRCSAQAESTGIFRLGADTQYPYSECCWPARKQAIRHSKRNKASPYRTFRRPLVGRSFLFQQINVGLRKSNIDSIALLKGKWANNRCVQIFNVLSRLARIISKDILEKLFCQYRWEIFSTAIILIATPFVF